MTPKPITITPPWKITARSIGQKRRASATDTHCPDIERDSQKDEAVVFIFIIATGGLLAWAVLKPWIERYLEVRTVIQPERGDGQRLTRGDCRPRASADHTYPLQSRNTERSGYSVSYTLYRNWK